MRPPRLSIVAAFLVSTAFLTVLKFRSSHTPQIIETTSASSSRSDLHAFFSFRTPFSLFPPNAIITLTYENSTAFLARPAAFGPPLPTDGLKGQVWIGSGFGDDGIRQGPMVAGAEGELGCSDVPGWLETYKSQAAAAAAADARKSTKSKSATSAIKEKAVGRGKEGLSSEERKGATEDSARAAGHVAGPSVNDGTDDHLHHPLPGSKVSKTDKKPDNTKGNHADIQSLQEGAEITGKVVLLSRGGCGFLEKVKWAQRRGAIALIVGDDTKGGPLIQMYARGDTSNVTIPSIFTSRTTAHLLSSLIGPGNFLEDAIDLDGKPTWMVHHTSKIRKGGKKVGSQPTFTSTAVAAGKPTATARATSKAGNKKGTTKVEEKTAIKNEQPGWFRALFLGSNSGKSNSDSNRPPSSGQLDWVLVDDWKDDESSGSKKIPTKLKNAGLKAKSSRKDKPASDEPVPDDDFQIGVQDWRDPDLVGTSPDAEGSAVYSNGKSDVSNTQAKQFTKGAGTKPLAGALEEIPDFVPKLRGGSITPGSGEYGTKDTHANEDNPQEEAKDKSRSKGLLTTIFGDDEEDVEFFLPHIPTIQESEDEEDEVEGLWVTLTPTNGASPLLDTLLVLVVSPLVTLTVVYALLLVRSRIRRRRWRAPKSVVERLPVRTYQTISNPTPQVARLPTTAESSVTTPLLQQSPPSRPRPRSRTTTGVPDHADPIRVNIHPLEVPPRSPEPEMHQGSHSSQWRKYMGKQVECVVCLEEYVDGVSRVMSLPCGHEFHVDCITPWLTTRRRTCPICKGDVVRSLARGSPSSPRYDSYQHDSDSDSQEGGRSSSALPMPNNDDLEQGIPTRAQRSPQSSSWRGFLASSLGSGSRSPRPTPQLEEDRNR
ncbi:hypothetical protein BJ875DRAFT_124333 [Amylocarpus encephaloides]|uniref:RING-type domain-containing protein n=1 Tax=Amylocarpus encephaloides TaxID=45428 RepID=A0A9P7YDL7_9HELO|nr:hypothetical protein BJ875DRAFT_124333 [Amylocarpus encephaloides]